LVIPAGLKICSTRMVALLHHFDHARQRGVASAAVHLRPRFERQSAFLDPFDDVGRQQPLGFVDGLGDAPGDARGVIE
jgi:hypothetical protein